MIGLHVRDMIGLYAWGMIGLYARGMIGLYAQVWTIQSRVTSQRVKRASELEIELGIGSSD